ncbi:MAG TPA: WD40 repeat domain-containing protein, partial [Pirellulales bacterium]|nr:WD40 repeat domain-containing protein [Pirellulales bacterium]
MTGHTEQIGALAFDAGGKLLVSAAADRTFCVWSLGDVYENLGIHGALRSVAVTRGPANGLVVVRGDGEKRLKENDIVLGFVEQGELRTVASPYEFYLAIQKYKPGQHVVLRCRHGAAQPHDVQLTAGQAVDDRQPLFTFYAEPRAPQPRPGARAVDWIGWAPSGPYDVSDSTIEERIGWHFNPSADEPAVVFCAASEYAKFRHPGLLQDLLTNPLDPIRPPDPPPPPTISLRFEQKGIGPPTVDGDKIVRLTVPDVTLHVAIDKFDRELIDTVTWRAYRQDQDAEEEAGRARTPLRAAGFDWWASLDKVDWRRGEQGIEVVFRTNERKPREFTRRVTVRYQPGPPKVTITRPLQVSQESMEQDVHFEARVEAANRLQSQPIVELSHQFEGRELGPWELEPGEDHWVRHGLNLQPGRNVITLTARNGDIPAGADKEAVRRESAPVDVRVVHFQPPAKPLIDLVATASGAEPQAIADERWQLVLGEPKFRVHGKITAPKKARLAQAEWRWGPDGEWQAFENFAVGNAELSVDQSMALPEGADFNKPYQLNCRAKTANGADAAAEITVVYQPLLPAIALTGPPRDSHVVEGPAPAEVMLTAKWEPEAGEPSFEVAIVREPKALPNNP